MTPTATDKTNRVLVQVILDRSGSMGSTRDSTISGYNEYIQGLRQDKDTEYTVTLIQFDAPLTNPELTVTYQDQALVDVPPLGPETYQPRGNTPLYDAIGECTRRVEPKGRAVICLIITDGMENASQEFTKDTVKALIQQKEAEGWVFSFLGANIDSYAVGGSVGMAAGATANYVQGHEKTMYQNLAAATMNRAEGYRTEGVHTANLRSFFSDEQRCAIENPVTTTTTVTTTGTIPGGRPAAPARFQTPKRRGWTVTGA